MTDKIDKTSYFDKPYRYNVKIDSKLIIDLFNKTSNMNINEVKQFMMSNQIPYNIVDINGNTLVHQVLLEDDILKTENQRLHMIKFLYNENANLDAPNNLNLTPLHIACHKQFFEIIKYLIELGVDINYKDNFGNTPLHRLFSGNIKPEEKTTPGNIIPIPKKMDMININKWKENRTKIWNEIKDSYFIQSIDKTLKASIGSDEEEINVVKNFQEQLINMNLDLTKKDDIKKLTELQSISINNFKNIIEKKWSKFATITDINIHPVEKYSYPTDDPSKLSIIKNSDTRRHLLDNINKSFTDIKVLLNDKIRAPLISIDFLNNVLLQDFITDN